MIAIRFLKVQTEWVVFKNDSFFRKRNKKRSFNDRFQKQLTTLYTGSTEETVSGYCFSLGSSKNGQLATPRMTEDNYVNVINASLINNSVNSNVCNFVEFNPEVKVKFNPKVKDILRPQEALGKDILRPQGIWEKI